MMRAPTRRLSGKTALAELSPDQHVKRKRVGAIDDNLDEKIDHKEYVKNRDFVFQAMETDHEMRNVCGISSRNAR